ncbi:MAG: methyltransferase domain-containing protein [Candidatus Omnitrophota bacterium]
MISLRQKNKMRLAFSNAASRYEEAAHIQKRIGIKLLNKIRIENNSLCILDAGMGTGWLARELSKTFSKSRVFGFDVADGMIREAKKKGVKAIGADCMWFPFKRESFDLVISNLVYQWVADPKKAFQEVHDSLKTGGSFCAAIFGERTLWELFFSLSQADKKFDFKKLPNQNEIHLALSQSGFKDFHVSSVMEKVPFNGLFDVIRWLKAIGANQRNDVFVGKNLLKKADQVYQKNFSDGGKPQITFETIFVEAKK